MKYRNRLPLIALLALMCLPCATAAPTEEAVVFTEQVSSITDDITPWGMTQGPDVNDPLGIVLVGVIRSAEVAGPVVYIAETNQIPDFATARLVAQGSYREIRFAVVWTPEVEAELNTLIGDLEQSGYHTWLACNDLNDCWDRAKTDCGKTWPLLACEASAVAWKDGSRNEGCQASCKCTDGFRTLTYTCVLVVEMPRV